MNSFDVFDTLIARRFVTTHNIWNILEHEFNIPGFAQKRPIPDTGGRTFEEIYTILVEDGVIPIELKETIRDREIELEMFHSFPVQENMEKVKEGDILISDMYLSPGTILQLARANGLDKQVTIYQSNGDKARGIVWEKLLNNKPTFHLGDNEHSDYNKPKEFGIKAVHYPGTGLTQLENTLIQGGLDWLALLIREIRLSSSIKQYKEYFELSNQYNLPLLFLFAEIAHRKYKDRNIVFLGRDCQLLHKIYNAFYTTAYYLPFSRKAAFSNPKVAAEYLTDNAPVNPVYIDISSTGGTWRELEKFIDIEVFTFIYGVNTFTLPKKFSYKYDTDNHVATNLMIEIMNCGDHGHLSSISKIHDKLYNTVYGKKELPTDLIKILHTSAIKAVELAPIYVQGVRNQLNSLPDENIDKLYVFLAQTITNNLSISVNIKGFLKAEEEYHKQVLTMRSKL